MTTVRGRIIFGFIVDLAQLDTQATAAAGAYDHVFKEPVVTRDPQGRRVSGRKESTIRLPCQVETGTFQAQQMTPTANAPASKMTLVFHFRDLERLKLIDGATGQATIRVNDRVVQILTKDGRIEQVFPNPPGLFVIEATPSGFGFGGRKELLVVRCGDRPQAVTGPGG